MKPEQRVSSRSKIAIVFTLCLAGLVAATEALADAGQTPSSPAAGGAFIGFAIVYLTRKRAIGGWLLYYYMQLYVSLVISLIFVPQIFSNLAPGKWDNALRYVMFFLSVVPILVSEIVEVIAASRLLWRRTEHNVKILKYTLAALIATSIASVAIDAGYFNDNESLFLDVLTLVFSVIWYAYFTKSQRVRMVFVEHSWVYQSSSEKRHLTTEDKKRLRRRAVIAAAITFVIFLLIMGSSLSQEGKPPSAAIFAVPTFYAVIAAIIAWFVPLRKKTKDVLSPGENKTQVSDSQS